MTTLRGSLTVVTVLLVAVTAARAQTVTGTLVNAHTGGPVGGAYVVLLDGDSLGVMRVLTDALGRFTIHPPRPSSYRLRTLRIGYRSIVSPPFTVVQGKVSEFQLRLEPVLVRLAALRIEGDARECRVIGEQALEVLAVWEEARKALEAVAWSELEELVIYEVERFERWYSFSYRLLNEKRSTAVTRRVMPFRSRSVEELEERGYVVLEEDSVVYEAPDAEVFFSTPFLQNHCFWLDQDKWDGRPVLGLRFEPVSGRTQADIKGVFWLDGESGALERLDLRYVNVGVWQRERGAAGRLEFERLPDGRWFVSRWWIRMPLVRRVEGLKGPVWGFEETVVGFEEEGGEVLKVYALDGGTVYARGRAALSGVVFDSTTGRGLAGAYVRLIGTDYVTITAADGSYWLTDLAEGRYTVTFQHPRAAFIGLADEQDVDLEEGAEARADLALPSPPVIVERLCRNPALAREQGLLLGTVRGAAGDSLVGGASIRVVWQGQDERGVRRIRAAEVVTDSRGVYRVCVPRAAPLSLEVTVDGVLRTAVPAMFGGNALKVLDVELPEREPDRPAVFHLARLGSPAARGAPQYAHYIGRWKPPTHRVRHTA